MYSGAVAKVPSASWGWRSRVPMVLGWGIWLITAKTAGSNLQELLLELGIVSEGHKGLYVWDLSPFPLLVTKQV